MFTQGEDPVVHSTQAHTVSTLKSFQSKPLRQEQVTVVMLYQQHSFQRAVAEE